MKAVYVIAEEARDLCKIGIAGNPKGRLGDLQVASARALFLEAAWRCDDARALERAAHKHLDSCRRAGEWFAISPCDAACAIGFEAASLGMKLERIDTEQIRVTFRQFKRLDDLPLRAGARALPATSRRRTKWSERQPIASSPLQRWRLARGMSLEELGQRVSICRTTIWRAESGVSRPSLEFTKRLVRETGLSPAQIMEPWYAAAEPEPAQ